MHSNILKKITKVAKYIDGRLMFEIRFLNGTFISLIDLNRFCYICNYFKMLLHANTLNLIVMFTIFTNLIKY